MWAAERHMLQLKNIEYDYRGKKKSAAVVQKQVIATDFIHGTNSRVLQLMAATKTFELIPGIAFATKFKYAPDVGEVTMGGYSDVFDEGHTSFGKASMEYDPEYNKYNLFKIWTNYAMKQVHRDTSRSEAYIGQCISSGCTNINKLIMLYDSIGEEDKVEIAIQLRIICRLLRIMAGLGVDSDGGISLYANPPWTDAQKTNARAWSIFERTNNMHEHFDEGVTFEQMGRMWHESLKENIDIENDERFLNLIGLTKSKYNVEAGSFVEFPPYEFTMNANLPFLMHFFAQRCNRYSGWSQTLKETCNKYAMVYEERLKTFSAMKRNEIAVQPTYPIVFVISGSYSNIIDTPYPKMEYRISSGAVPSLAHDASLPIYGIITSNEYIGTLREWLHHNSLTHIQIFNINEVVNFEFDRPSKPPKQKQTINKTIKKPKRK